MLRRHPWPLLQLRAIAALLCRESNRLFEENPCIRRANSLPFGLGSYVFTASLKRANRIADGPESGMVGINTYMLGMPESPFGGVKQSGYGSESGAEGTDAYLVTKFMNYA
jgi:succinate-semialdehyde dehydrogenase/glutarate-semialdehyde dehydrogenase